LRGSLGPDLVPDREELRGEVVAEETLGRAREVRVRLRGVEEVRVSLDWSSVKFRIST
jgi:hypothetical protein